MVQFLDKDRQIYLILNQTLFPVANPDTVDALGLWFGEVNYVMSSYMQNVSRGRVLNKYDPAEDMNDVSKWIRIARAKPRNLEMPKPDLYIKDQIQLNIAALREYVERARPGLDYSKRACSNNDGYVRFDKNQYGRFGNALIELKNGIFFAEITNRTFILQDWQVEYLSSFNVEYLMQKFCVIGTGEFDQNNTGAYIETVHAMDAYGGYNLWDDPVYKDFKLPPFNKYILPLLESYSMEVFACIWASVREEDIDATVLAMADFLNNNTLYIAVHKRSFEGECNDMMRKDTSIILETTFPGNYSDLSDYNR